MASLSKELPYSVPKGYFEENLSVLPSLIQEAEKPVLDGIDKTLPYTVPLNYFGDLPQQVLAKVSQPKAKVVPLFSRRWMRIAVAAVVGGIVVVGGYQYLNNSQEVQTANQQPADTTSNWVAKNEPAVVQDIKKVSTKELDEFIQAASLNSLQAQKRASQPSETKEIMDLLKGVSKKEIDTFLEQIPTADKDLFIID
jgi:hypothetical protein